MKTLLSIIFVGILLPLTALSQSNYRPGYVIKSTGDTLRGYINYREWSRSPKSVEFKRSVTDPHPVEFNTASVKSFNIKGFDTYIAYNGPISVRGMGNIADLPRVLDTSSRIDSAFLKVIVKGPNVTLLYHTDNVRYRYFILENDKNVPYELKFYQFLNEQDRIIPFAPFVGQIDQLLKKYANTTIDAIGKLSGEEYNEDIILRYVRVINNNNNTIEEKRTSGIRIFGGLAGVFTMADFNGPTGGFNFQQHANSVSPGINIGVDFLNNVNIQRSYFRLALSLYSASPTFTGSVAYFSSTQYTFKFSGQYIYSLYNTDKLKYFIGLGAGIVTTSASNSKLVATQGGVIITPNTLQPLGNSTTSLKVGQYFSDPYDISGGTMALEFSTGIVLNHTFEVFLDATPFSFGFSATNNAATLQTQVYSYKNYAASIGINYFFGKK